MKDYLSRLMKPHHIPIAIIVLAALVLSTGLVLTLIQRPAPASTGNIYLTTPTVTAEKDAEVRFTLRINPGARIDTVTATVKYDASKLSYKKAEYPDSPFASQIPATNKDSTVTVQVAKLGGQTVESDAFVATLVFTALKSGTHTLDLTAGNAAHAGVATNPALMGKAVEQPIAGNGAAQAVTAAQASQNSTNSPNNSPLVLATNPVAGALQAIGVSKSAARQAAPWVGGLLALLVVAVLALIGRIIYKKKHETKEPRHDIAPIA